MWWTMKIEFYRGYGGYDMPDFYLKSVQYSVFCNWSDLMALANLIESKCNNMIRIASVAEGGSPASILVIEGIENHRLLVTERPVLEKGARRMEIVIAGSSAAYRRFFSAIEECRGAIEGRSGAMDCRFDGIMDDQLAPFGVALAFPGNRENYLSNLDHSVLFPNELEYMDLEDSSESWASEIIEFKEGILRQLLSGFR
jgi:hypothetical protein